MVMNRRTIDKVRASRDGHEFHEAWTARKALQLLLPRDNLVGIAVEGLSPTDSGRAEPETVEIADLVLYYGKYTDFRGADRVVILQFKYSIAGKSTPFRQSDAKKTIEKFADAFRDLKKTYSAKEVKAKLEFELITNRPIHRAFQEALISIANKRPLKGETKKQAAQFQAACQLNGAELVEFAKRLRLGGLAGSLNKNKQDLSRQIVDWSPGPDAMARARLGAIRQLVRDKA